MLGNDICAQINDLIGDLQNMSAELTAESEVAAEKAAAVIASHQRRIFLKANFKRNKQYHIYNNVWYGLIGITKRKTGRARVKMRVGFDSETLKNYPELIEIEFGRPGKSPRHSGAKDKLGRKKGEFPEAATVMPVRVGFQAAKEEAFRTYADEMFAKTIELYRR